MLALVFGVHDLNSGNIGVNSDGDFAVVDCYVGRTILRTNIVNKFQTGEYGDGVGVNSDGITNDVLSGISADERAQFAKNILPKWNAIRTATSDLIGAEKAKLRDEHGIKFGTCTDDVNKYIRDVQENYELLCKAFL